MLFNYQPVNITIDGTTWQLESKAAKIVADETKMRQFIKQNLILDDSEINYGLMALKSSGGKSTLRFSPLGKFERLV